MIPKGDRLRNARAFHETYKEGTTVGEQLIVLHVLASTDRPHTRLVGFAVSKKVGNAVERNRVRRRLRALARELLPCLGRGFQVVVGARPAAARATFSDLRTSMQRAFSRAGLLAMTAPPPPATMPQDPGEDAGFQGDER